ncbi:MAG: ATP-dependent DNA ligase [Vulcanimicrobiaceae bacterium]
MTFAVPLETLPMEARLVAEIPRDDGWQYEPKWDGFRCLAYRSGSDVRLQSKSGQPLERYFPEIVAALAGLAADRFVLDGELVVETGGALSFDALLQRIHPAASRVRKLATETPATYLVFDLLAEGVESVIATALGDRRERLERFAARTFARDDPREDDGARERGAGRVRLSPATRDLATVDGWYARVGGALDGVVAKRLDAPYRSGERDAVVKVKRIRSADCVVGGYRTATTGATLGSLLLGLYDATGALDYVGHTSGYSAAEKAELLARLEALAADTSFTGRAPGGPSRWNRGKSGSWHPVRPELVLEVSYDQVSAGRFRHGTRPLRWRPDKAPRACELAQILADDRTIALARDAR